MALRGKKKQLNVLLDPDEADKLKALADKQERSVSQMAAILIRDGINRIEENSERSA